MTASSEMANSSDCYASDQSYSPVALSCICLASFVISLPGVFLGLHQYCVKNRLSALRTERLLLYLAFVAFSFSFLGCFQWIAVFVDDSSVAATGCTVLGYLWFLVGIFFLMITSCIGLHFFLLVCRPKCLRVTNDELTRTSKRMEFVYVGLSGLVAIVCSPWPFFKNVFGYNQWICWIITITDDECGNNSAGETVTTAFYAATLIAFSFSFTVLVIVHILTCTRGRNFPHVWVFSTYLVVTLAVMFITMVVSFINPEDIPPVVHGAKILSIGVLPLCASLVTTIAIIFKMWSNRASDTAEYNSLHSVRQARSAATYGNVNSDDGADTSNWSSPPTDILADGRSRSILYVDY